MDLFAPIVASVFGLILGSFFNVVIYRLPRHESIVSPGSHCPKCNRPIRPWENIPVASYLALRGKCSSCKTRIPVSYPLMELSTGVASLVLFIFFIKPALAASHSSGTIAGFIVQTAVLLVAIPISIIDFRHFVIPEILTLPLLAIAVACAFWPGAITPLQCGLGILVGGGFLYLVGFIFSIFLKKESMGFGDVELMALVGAAFGWKTALLTMLLGFTFGALVGLALMATKRLSKNHQIPFGPFLAAGLWISVLWGDSIISLYCHFVISSARI
jgi:leader peptidase (prepilin peptidase)/N-methyltransferase